MAIPPQFRIFDFLQSSHASQCERRHMVRNNSHAHDAPRTGAQIFEPSNQGSATSFPPAGIPIGKSFGISFSISQPGSAPLSREQIGSWTACDKSRTGCPVGSVHFQGRFQPPCAPFFNELGKPTRVDRHWGLRRSTCESNPCVSLR